MRVPLLVCLTWAALSFPGWAADKPAPLPPPEPKFLTATRIFRTGHAEVLPFQVAKAPAEKTVYPLKIDGDAFTVLLPPTVLPGRTLGFMRLEPRQPGDATLHLGKTGLAAHVISGTPDTALPEIVTPTAGCDVWGVMTVGVELFSPRPAQDKRTVTLRLPDGKELSPKIVPVAPGECFRRFAFEVDADALPPGVALLDPILHDGKEPILEGDPLWMNVVRLRAGELLSGACATTLDSPRADKAGAKPPPVEKDPQATGGLCVSNMHTGAGWCMEVEIPTAGYYQLFMRVRGQEGGGALPTVGLRLNEVPTPLAAARLADTAWHRLAIGTPFRLPPGDHILTAAYMNDFKFGPDQRGLFLDRYELLRLAATAAPPPPSDMMMAGGEPAMTMEGAAEKPEPSMMSAAAMNPNGSDDVDMSEIGRPGSPLRIAFDRIFDGQPVDGPVVLHARAWWQNAGMSWAVPRTELRVNGVAVASQPGADLWFRLAPGSLLPGANTVSLRAALPSGLSAEAPPQRLDLQVPANQSGPARRLLRFPVREKNWTGLLLGKPSPIDRPALFASAPPAFLTPPAGLAGDFQVIAEVTPAQGASQIAFGLGEASGKPLGTAPVANSDAQLGKVHLTGGDPEKLWFALASPEPAAFSLRAVRLEELSGPTPPPVLRLLYPVEGAVLEPAEAVVAQAFAPVGLSWVDVEADGKPLGMRLRPPRNLGPLVFPLAVRGWAPGLHHLALLCQSWNGQTARSATIGVTVPARPLPDPGTYSRAVRLLDRFGYGPEPEELAAVLSQGEEVWLKRRLAEEFSSLGLQALDKETGSAFPEENGAGAPPRAMHQAILTANPVRARFVFWTENHFSTWVDKVMNRAKWREHLRFWQAGVAPFPDLLRVSATSPAMLHYLDQSSSYAGKLNENYAREIMELHTLGVHGGYTQADVTTLAGVLNGWTLSTEADLEGVPSAEQPRVFRFDPQLNDGKARQVFGLEFPPAPPAERFDRISMALEMLAAHPSTAAFISRKLVEHYVGVPAPPPLVDRLTKLYLETGGDMQALLFAISQAPEFWKAPPRLATPFDYVVKLERLGSNEPDPNQANAAIDFLKQSGQGLFDRPTPDGYQEGDREYAGSNALLQRWKLARSLDGRLSSLLPPAWLDPKGKWDAARDHQAIDFLALRLTGRLLSPASQKAAEEMLSQTADPAPQRAALLASFVCQLPEANLR